MKVSDHPTARSQRTEHSMVVRHRHFMTRSDRRAKWIIRTIGAALTVALWWFTELHSGYSVSELVMFAGPGLVLTMAASWSSHIFHRDEWTWAVGMRTALIGVLVTPPLIGFGLAFLSAMNHDAVLVIVILGAWLALGGGVFVGCVRALRDDVRQRRSAAPVRLVLHRPSAGRSRHRLPVRAGRRPPWVEYQPPTQTPTSRQRPSA
jgi:hypothetical protein